MTVTCTRNRLDPALVDATIRYANGLFQFLQGVLPAQVLYLKGRDDEEVREIASSRNALYLPGLKGVA